MRQWFSYSNTVIEEALYEIPLLSKFAGVNASEDAMPYESAILRFRYLLEKPGMSVDAALIYARSSSKDEDKEQSPGITQPKKGNQCHFVMKAHVDADADSGLINTLECRADQMSDITMMVACLQ